MAALFQRRTTVRIDPDLLAKAVAAQTESEPASASKAGALWSDGFGRLGTRAVQIIALTIVGIGAFIVLSRLSLVMLPVVIAIILAAAMFPVVRWLRNRGIPALAATILALLAIVVVLGGVVTMIVGAVRNQWGDLVDSAMKGINELWKLLEGLPITITEEQFESARDTVLGFLTSSQFGSGALAGLSATGAFVTGFVLMVVVLFFFLKDGPRIWEFMLRPLEGANYDRARRVGTRTVDILGDYIRGTATVAAVDAVGIGLGLVILDVPLALPLAAVVFLSAFIPLVGATLAGVLAALVALVANGPITAIIVIIVVVLVNQLEGNFLQPVVMGRSLKLHALVILLALTAGTILGGIVGAVLAVPITAVFWGIVNVWNGDNEPAYPAKRKRNEDL